MPPKTKFVDPLPKKVEFRDDEENVRLMCKVNRPEAGCFWTKDGQRLVETPNVKIIESGYERKLIIQEVDEEAEGAYWTWGSRISLFFFHIF